MTRNKESKIPPIEFETWACGGLREHHDYRVGNYMMRGGGTGGGSKAVTSMATDKYELNFNELTELQKANLRTQAEHEFAWTKDTEKKRVFSTQCQKSVSIPKDSIVNGQLPACENCLKLLKLHEFQVVINKRVPLNGDMKYMNSFYIHKENALLYGKIKGLEELIIAAEEEKVSPYLQFVKGVLDGKYKDYEVFLGLVEAMVKKVERESEGKGLQNMSYAPAFDEFMHTIMIISPRVHKMLSEHLQIRTINNYRIHDSQKPRFPLSISFQCFLRVKEKLSVLDYTNGPVCLSCDEVKIHATWRLFYDGHQQKHFILGAVGEPVELTDPDNFRQVVSDNNLVLAQKLRVWCLQIPLPNMVTIVVAAKAVGNKTTVEECVQMHKEILHGLMTVAEANVVSCANDGASTERGLHARIVDDAPAKVEKIIPHPAGQEPIVVRIPINQGRHMTPIQDSKHALKTGRNNMSSGARVLVVGNYPILYRYQREIAFQDGSPTYVRDVDRPDKQDDNAAVRTFAADTVAHVHKNNPERRGHISFLYIYGDFIDAFQNREMTHLERLPSVFQMLFFLDIWEAFLDKNGYPKNVHYISREANEIIRNMINGFLALIYIYRDHCDGIWPLLFWLHSSEPCEHVFGECRKIKKDFTHEDFIFMIPKLDTLLKTAVWHGKSGDLRARANGYAHTYLDSTRVDLLRLATFPSDEEISSAAEQGWLQAQSVCNYVGISTVDLGLKKRRLNGAKIPQQGKFIYQKIAAELEGQKLSYFKSNLEDVLDEDSEESDSENDDENETIYTQALTDWQEESPNRDPSVATIMCASVALSISESEKIHTMPDLDEDQEKDIVNQEALQIKSAYGIALKKKYATEKDVPQTASKGAGNVPTGESGMWTQKKLDVTNLIALRYKHQTEAARKAIRVRGLESSNQKTGQSMRHEFNQRFREIVQSQHDQAIGTGLERRARHDMPLPPAVEKTGNAANAEIVSKEASRVTLQKRMSSFEKAKAPCLDEINSAGITALRRAIKEDDYVFAFFEDEIMVCKILSLYTKSGGNYGSHSWVSEVTNIASISHTAVQLWPNLQHREFRRIPAPPRLQVNLFAQLDSMALLAVLKVKPSIDEETGNLELSNVDYQLFLKLETDSALTAFKKAATLFNQRKKQVEAGVSDNVN